MTAHRPALSPRELAAAIGVSESSVKRWADAGSIEVARTAGGHRRIALDEAIRFIRSSNLTVVEPAVLGLGELDAARAAAGDADEDDLLFEALRAGDALAARGLLLSRYLAGTSVAELIDGPVHEAARRMGELWHDSDEGILCEHRATDILIQGLNQLRSLLPAPPPGAVVAVGCAPGGDPYLIPSLAAAMVLRDLGVAATNLGPDTPLPVLELAVEGLGATLAWVSSSASTAEPAPLATALHHLADRLAERDGLLFVGGRRAGELELAHASIHVGRSMTELGAFAEALLVSRQATR